MDVAEEVAGGGLQACVQLRVYVKLPGIGRFLHLQGQRDGDAKELCSRGGRAA